MRAVNLLPSESRSGRGVRVDPVLGAGAAVTLVVAVGLAGGFVLEHSHASSAQRQLAAARAELAQLQAKQQPSSKPSRVLSQPAALAQVQPWQQAVETVLATRAPLDQMLVQLARIVPSNVTLTSLSLAGAGGTATPTAGAATPLSLSGSAYSEQGVAELLSRLTLVPGLSQVTLSSNTLDPKSGAVTFEIGAQLAQPSTPVAGPTAAADTTTTATTTGGAA